MAVKIVEDSAVLTLDFWDKETIYNGQVFPVGTLACDALNIPGLQKGFAAAPARSAPQEATGHSLRLFKPGDRVVHAVFGRGTVMQLEGEGSAQKVSVEFENGAKKRFSAGIAPLRMIDQ